MKKYIKDMTPDELKKVILENENLQNEVCELLMDSERFWIDEIINTLGLVNWSIDPYDYSYVNFDDAQPITENILKAIDEYGILDDDVDKKRLAKLETAESNFGCMEYDNKNYDNLEKFIAKEVEYFEEEIAKVFVGIYEHCNNKDAIYDYFMECVNENYDEHYIKDNDFSVAYVQTEKKI